MSDSQITPPTGKLPAPAGTPSGTVVATPVQAAPRPVATPPAAPPPPPAPPPAACLDDFVSGAAEAKLRDLLAFAMATEARRPALPDEVDTWRRKAEAELQAHAFRTLHNQVETIRLEAAKEQMSRMHRPPGFGGIVLANIVAMLLVAGGLVAFWWLRLNNLPGA